METCKGVFCDCFALVSVEIAGLWAEVSAPRRSGHTNRWYKLVGNVGKAFKHMYSPWMPYQMLNERSEVCGVNEV